MTKERFRNELDVVGGMFIFNTNKHEGMIGVTMSNVVVWVDDNGFGERADEAEPRNVGEFNSIDELLSKFNVDGKSFAEYVLPEISKLHKMYA